MGPWSVCKKCLCVFAAAAARRRRRTRRKGKEAGRGWDQKAIEARPRGDKGRRGNQIGIYARVAAAKEKRAQRDKGGFDSLEGEKERERGKGAIFRR